jgi:hypothetical protein
LNYILTKLRKGLVENKLQARNELMIDIKSLMNIMLEGCKVQTVQQVNKTNDEQEK